MKQRDLNSDPKTGMPKDAGRTFREHLDKCKIKSDAELTSSARVGTDLAEPVGRVSPAKT